MTGMGLDLTADAVTLTQQLVDIESVSGNEAAIADAVEQALAGSPPRLGQPFWHTLGARTDLGRDEHVVIAGHIDTVPVNDNLPSRLTDTDLHGLGSCDMKAGVAIALRTAATVPAP